MDWHDQGIVLAIRMHGESSAIVEVLTASRGRHPGLVRGAHSRRLSPVLQPGNEVEVHWRGRLEEHLGTYQIEPVRQHAALLLDDPRRLSGLAALCALAEVALPEREPHDALYRGFHVVLDALVADGSWAALIVRWEVQLLQELGFGLDLSVCAVTGLADDLSHVSPRTGRAVSRAAALPYEGRLLPLPAFLGGASQTGDARVGADGLPPGDIAAGFALTGHFITRHLLEPRQLKMPPARSRLVSRFLAQPGTSGSVFPQ